MTQAIHFCVGHVSGEFSQSCSPPTKIVISVLTTVKRNDAIVSCVLKEDTHQLGQY